MLTVKFTTKNAAFDVPDREEETANIVALVARNIRLGLTEGTLFDRNGNSVGNWKFT